MKVLTMAALERDKELCNVWEVAMSQFTNPDMFVALDESAVDGKTMQQTHGWSVVGIPSTLPSPCYSIWNGWNGGGEGGFADGFHGMGGGLHTFG